MSKYFFPTLVCIGVVVLACLLMWRGWSARKRRQSELGPLAPVPERYDELPPDAVVSGTYIVTTLLGDWLARVAVHTLGVKSRAELFIFDEGLVLAREGAQHLWIPYRDVIAVRQESGINGKFVEKDGLLIISWMLNSTAVDTGFRLLHPQEQENIQKEILRRAPQAKDYLPAL
ncbi:hypothetical protein ACN08Z_06575 [Rothia sp. P7181]|uniref:PH-like domain-containing protein n=1 Tax=Rothia sp. P7181 TaxID=3402663 RepID=UPI003AEED271